jgi:ABC-type dipeptide/oligopeptide/nickel transport system ATPase subunit
VIEIKDLVVKYRRQKQETVALDGINLRMASGDIYTLSDRQDVVNPLCYMSCPEY